ncbi:MAG: FecR family protein [Polyangiales bacterium]
MTEQDLRARLRALAEHEPLRTLSAAERVHAEQAAEASVRTRDRRGVGLMLAGSLMLAGFVCWHVFSEPRQRIAAPEVVRGCRAFRDRPIEQAHLEGRATFAASPASAVMISLSAECDVSAELRAGSLYVHAEDLQGRALRVRTPHGHVEVRGTIFAVHTSSDALTVEVDEGHVEVFPTDGRTISLRAGQAIRVEARSAQHGSAHLPARNRLRTAVHLPPHSAKNDVPDAGPAAEPERVWRTGSVPAPNIPPEPKSSLTEDGRPMRKPHLTPGE